MAENKDYLRVMSVEIEDDDVDKKKREKKLG